MLFFFLVWQKESPRCGVRIDFYCFISTCTCLFACCVLIFVGVFCLCQCKLSPVARDTLLTDINLDTVDMMTNFDGNEQEPVVLPSRLPVGGRFV